MKKLFLVLVCMMIGLSLSTAETDVGVNLDLHMIGHIKNSAAIFENIGATIFTSKEITDIFYIDNDLSLRGLIGLVDENSESVIAGDISGTEFSWKTGFSVKTPTKVDKFHLFFGIGFFWDYQSLKLNGKELESYSRNGYYAKVKFDFDLNNDWFFNVTEHICFTGAVRPEIPSDSIVNMNMALGLGKRL